MWGTVYANAEMSKATEGSEMRNEKEHEGQGIDSGSLCSPEAGTTTLLLLESYSP
jgi:hypothetical protein